MDNTFILRMSAWLAFPTRDRSSQCTCTGILVLYNKSDLLILDTDLLIKRITGAAFYPEEAISILCHHGISMEFPWNFKLAILEYLLISRKMIISC